MIKTLAVCSCAALVAGCALPALDPGAINALKGRTVVRVVPPTPKMAMTTPATAAVVGFGLAGGVAAAAGGAKPGGVSPLDLPDPSLAIAAKLAQQLDQRYGTRTVDTVINQPISGFPELVKLALPLAPYSLEVSTFNMNMAFYMTEPSRYRILFTTVANLIDNKTQKSLSTGVCVHQPDDTAVAATYDEMLANHGERAQRDLAAGAEFCAQQLQRDMFSK